MYHTEYRCVKCKGSMSWHVTMYRDGRCPLCGYKGPLAGTVVDCTEHAYKAVRIGKWWQFWKYSRQYQSK